MNTVLISLASNTPDKLRQMNNAFAELQEMGLVAASSSIYETVACGSIKSPNYLNANENGVVDLRFGHHNNIKIPPIINN